ncbi:MAG: divergent PAP2 family protein [Lachnospiraceae bacterium]|nr:divergent PAP2 family protein [Lachnospiraceae bacterium]
MTTVVEELLQNKILVVGLLSWFVAQVLKTIIYAIVNHRIDFHRLCGDGGMPSGHSATVTGVATTTGLMCGFGSPLFAIACILAIVVMHDAMGVRRETGKQAVMINEMISIFNDMGNAKIAPEEKLKEFVGHTPFQVSMGFLLGLIVALVYCNLV